MKYRLEVRRHDFFLEGRDEEKSHVILELAKPSPAEIVSHGYLATIAEMQNATPRTVQLVTSWFEFLVDAYYAPITSSAAEHFEAIMEKLNAQSALYLKQHPEENIHILVTALVNEELHLAARGRVAAAVFYHHSGLWKYAEIFSPGEAAAPGQLFDQIISGQLRPGDRLFLGSAHIGDFFTADRIAKISEGKSMEEVAAHMERVLQELNSDFSFAGVWFSTVKILEEEKPITVEGHTPPGRSSESMNNLVNKTRGTAAILAPPIITFRKDRLVTTLLLLCKRGLTSGALWCVEAGRIVWHYAKNNKSAVAPANLRSWQPRTAAQKQLMSFRSWLAGLTPKRRLTFFAATGGVALALLTILIMAVVTTVSNTNDAARQTLADVQTKLQSADEAFTYQNEISARALVQEANDLLSTLPGRWQDKTATLDVKNLLQLTSDKIWRRKNIVFTDVGQIKAQQIVSANGLPVVLTTAGEIKTWRNGTESKLGEISNARNLWFDEENNRLVAELPDRHLTTLNTNGQSGGELNVAWLPDNTTVTAATFYTGRFYVYDGQALMVYRYDGQGNNLSTGKKWITDAGKPTGVTRLAAESSLWMLTAAGNVMRYTAGKLKPYRISGLTPAPGPLTSVWAAAEATGVYFLDRDNRRLIVTDRDGNLLNQFFFPQDTNLQAFALDEKETTVFGITDDGRLVKFGVK